MPRNGTQTFLKLTTRTHQRKVRMGDFGHQQVWTCFAFSMSKFRLYKRTALMSCCTELLWLLFRWVESSLVKITFACVFVILSGELFKAQIVLKRFALEVLHIVSLFCSSFFFGSLSFLYKCFLFYIPFSSCFLWSSHCIELVSIMSESSYYAILTTET